MELVHIVLNVVVPVLGGIGLVSVLPLVLFVRAISWVYNALFPDDVAGKVVVVCGASSGIGKETALLFAERGAKLALAARREGQLREVAHMAKLRGSQDVLAFKADLGDEKDAKKLIDSTLERFGKIDYLIANTGAANSFLFEEAESTTGMREVLDSTFWSNVYTTFYALPHLKASRGTIVVTASVASYLPFPRMSVYNAAKGAELNFFETLRAEVGNEVNMTIVFPGWTESDMSAGKFVKDEGGLQVNKEQRNMHIGPTPAEDAVTVARAIVSGATRKLRYVRIPEWYTTFFFYRLLAPELVEAAFRLVYLAPPGKKPLSKALLEHGGEQVVFQESIQSGHDGKAD
eukprot:SM000191S05229  [mRNA]  locus=s191:135635:137476:+ [translate_table: standard]